LAVGGGISISFVAGYPSFASLQLPTPTDRTEAIKTLVEKAVGKLVTAYMTTGTNDVVLVTELPDGSGRLRSEWRRPHSQEMVELRRAVRLIVHKAKEAIDSGI
jgi:hypothetical protein